MRRHWVVITALLMIILIVSFLSRDMIQRVILLPLAYVWWLLGLYYRAVPQWIVWALLVIIVFISALRNIPIKNPFQFKEKKNHKPAKGPIEDLSQTLNKVPRGVYYKWLIANRLGNIARELLDQREGQRRRGLSKLTGRDWQPSKEVSSYLDSGLNGSFADFPQSYWWGKSPSTPLDVDTNQVLEYIEYQMETSHDRHRKGI